MTRLFIITMLLALAVGVTGCKKNNKSTDSVSAGDPLGQPAYMDAGAAPAPSYEPAPQPLYEPQPAPATGGRTYTVQRGDTLWSIAAREYGNGNRWRDIANANGITNERSLPAGKTLIIP